MSFCYYIVSYFTRSCTYIAKQNNDTISTRGYINVFALITTIALTRIFNMNRSIDLYHGFLHLQHSNELHNLPYKYINFFSKFSFLFQVRSSPLDNHHIDYGFCCLYYRALQCWMGETKVWRMVVFFHTLCRGEHTCLGSNLGKYKMAFPHRKITSVLLVPLRKDEHVFENIQCIPIWT